MSKQKDMPAWIGALRSALWGAVGFGIGGAIGGTIAVDAAIFLGFAIMAGIGGMSLGLALKSWKMAGFLALAGAVGFPLGFYVCVFFCFCVFGLPVSQQSHCARYFCACPP